MFWRVIDSIVFFAVGNAMIFMEEKWVALSQLKRSNFYIRTMLAFGIDHVLLF